MSLTAMFDLLLQDIYQLLVVILLEAIASVVTMRV